MYQEFVWINNTDELYHHGIKGQKWGVRRFQNEDGSLTPRGQKRVDKYAGKVRKNMEMKRMAYKEAKRTGTKEERVAAKQAFKQAKKERKEAIKKAAYNLGKDETTSDVLAYGANNMQGIRQRAAKYMVDHGKEPYEAMRKSKRVMLGQAAAAGLIAGIADAAISKKLGMY